MRISLKEPGDRKLSKLDQLFGNLGAYLYCRAATLASLPVLICGEHVQAFSSARRFSLAACRTHTVEFCWASCKANIGLFPGLLLCQVVNMSRLSGLKPTPYWDRLFSNTLLGQLRHQHPPPTLWNSGLGQLQDSPLSVQPEIQSSGYLSNTLLGQAAPETGLKPTPYWDRL
ncbi:hypothetical protein AAFF_G00266510 [Aldrovandia affinis]|uniref:Uncharacterized protein n=1 Tax=Aldrovandia affinis TaxID=143900 RepID=A0AAD7W2K1_9TELE|nr:hypothetical protein AAFF_G00266510 [Aldrovandia affinis]